MPVRRPARLVLPFDKKAAIRNGAQSALVEPAVRRLRAFAATQRAAMTAFLSAGPCATVVVSQSDRPFATARRDVNARVVARQRLNEGLRERIAPDFRFCDRRRSDAFVIFP